MAFSSDLTADARLADHLLPDGLEAFIRKYREAGLSWQRLAREMWVATSGQVDVHPVTIREWWVRIDAGAVK